MEDKGKEKKNITRRPTNKVKKETIGEMKQSTAK
jgi:hypothetical protein